MNTQPLWLFLHLAGVVVWVGGMFFAYVCLRPVAAETLDPPLRLTLWVKVFERFFRFVWAAVAHPGQWIHRARYPGICRAAPTFI